MATATWRGSMSSTHASMILADDALEEVAGDVASGKGILASMLSWLRGAKSEPKQALRSGATVAPEVPVEIDESLTSQYGPVNPAWLLDSLERYAKAHRKHLYGPGLLVRMDSVLPPPAFRAIPRASLSFSPVTLHAGDYEDVDAAVRAWTTYEVQPDHAQVAWVINAILVRAALAMEPFIRGSVRLDTGVEEFGAVRAIFALQGNAKELSVSTLSNPVALHRRMHEAALHQWAMEVAFHENCVREELLAAFEQQPAGQAVFQRISEDLRSVLESSAVLARIRRSGAAFVDLVKLAEVCENFVAGIDRNAVRNALRHGNDGLNWHNYSAHLAPEVQAPILGSESHGALAFGHYPPRLLQHLHALNESAHPFGSWREKYDSFDYDGTFTIAAMQSLARHSSPALLNEFSSLSPRYLACLATGRTRVAPLEISYRAALADDWGCADSALAAGERAGRLLGLALSQVLSGQGNGLAKLPWARVLSHDTAQELLLRPMDDGAAVGALAAFFGYANFLRSKKQCMAQCLESLPTAQGMRDAPRDNALGSLLGMNKEHLPGGWPAAERAALLLAHEVAGATLPFVTKPAHGGARKVEWVAQLAACRPNYEHESNRVGGYRLAVRNPGGHLNVWSIAEVYARTDDKYSRTKTEDLTNEFNRFVIRGKGTPDYVAPLVLEIKVQKEYRCRTLSRAVSPQVSHVDLHMRPVTDTAPKQAWMLRKTEDGTRKAESLAEHYQMLMAQMRERVTLSLRARPYHAACVFPAVAVFLWTGGKLADDAKLRPLGAATAFKLARACVGSQNPYALGLLCREAANPLARSRIGVSLLDIALEAKDYRLAKGALEGLAANPRLPQVELAELVQASFGKLLERHPKLLQAALKCGATVDETAQTAWSRLHPDQKPPELQATYDAAAITAAIDTANTPVASIAADAAPPARRRLRAI